MAARYTVLLRTLLNDKECKAAIDKAMSTYPMYEAKNTLTYALIPTRSELNKKILNHFKYREIAFEAPGRFIDELQTTLEEIMPTYYSMYKSVDMMNEIDDIFGNIDITESYQEEGSGTSKGSSSANSSTNSTSSSNEATESSGESSSTTSTTNTNNSKEVSSDTPQSELNISAENIDSVDYASNVSWAHSKGTGSENVTNNSEASSNTTGSSEGSVEGTSSSSNENQSTTRLQHTLHKKGNQGVNTYAHDLLEFRELFTNIEQAIINDTRLQELFMCIY